MNTIKITLLTIALLVLILLSCNNSQSTASEKDLELQKKELDLKQKELDLKEKQLALDSVQKSQSATEKNKQTNTTEQKETTVKQNTPLKAKFVMKSEKLILIVNGNEFVVLKDFDAPEIHEGSEKGSLAVCSVWGGSGGTTWTATLEKNGDIKVEEVVQVRGGGELHSDVSEVLRIKKGNY